MARRWRRRLCARPRRVPRAPSQSLCDVSVAPARDYIVNNYSLNYKDVQKLRHCCYYLARVNILRDIFQNEQERRRPRQRRERVRGLAHTNAPPLALRPPHFFTGTFELECSFTLSLGMPRPSSTDLRPMNADKSCRESADGARWSSFKYPGSSTSGLAFLWRWKISNDGRLFAVFGMVQASSSVSWSHSSG
mmetsp:Transcript_231/g.797  ORF Transcript_231/g.797 Transcript_231/m.797 type:complete len:192 (+) Transcript_231:1380-1955(+)